MHGVSGNVPGCSFRFLFCILVFYLISELIYHLILAILVYGLKTLFSRDLGRL